MPGQSLEADEWTAQKKARHHDPVFGFDQTTYRGELEIAFDGRWVKER